MSSRKAFLGIDDKMTPLEKAGVINNNVEILKKYISANFLVIFAHLISYAPMSVDKQKTFFNLKNGDRGGFLYRYLITCAKDNGIPNVYIDRFFRAKLKYNRMKKNLSLMNVDEETKLSITKHFVNETKTLIAATNQRIMIKSDRQKKLDNIFLG